MKRLFILILVAVYLVPSSGLSFNLHYCGGFLNHISVSGIGHAGCCCGKMNMKSDCCKDRTIEFKLDCKQLKAEGINCTLFCGVPKIVFHSSSFHSLLTPQVSVWAACEFEPPDRGLPVDIFIENRSMRI